MIGYNKTFVEKKNYEKCLTAKYQTPKQENWKK